MQKYAPAAVGLQSQVTWKVFQPIEAAAAPLQAERLDPHGLTFTSTGWKGMDEPSESMASKSFTRGTAYLGRQQGQ